MSNKYAVIRISGHQHKVSEGSEFLIDKLDRDKPTCDVLMIVDGDKLVLGRPILEKAKVILKVLGDEKGEKIDGFKFKAKSRYRKHWGFRPQYTRLLVEKITG